MKNKQFLIKDIAEICGVSISTVSRVLNKNGRYSQATEKKILAACKKYNYQQNVIARSLRTNSLKIIGILVPDITNPFYAAIVKSCESYFFKNGYLTIVCNTERSFENEQRYVNALSNHIAAGLIIISNQRKLEPTNYNLTIPIIYIDRSPAPLQNTLMILSDNYGGALAATNYLINCKADPYFITTPTTEASSTKERIRGFKDVLKKQHIHGERIITLNNTSDELVNSPQNINNTQLINILKNNKNKIGFFTVNDNVAFAVVKLAIYMGVKIPDQLCIIGFDDSPLASLSVPQITTIRQNIPRISSLASENLLNSIKKRTISQSPVIIPVSLVKRDTT
ncbi:MAG: LacI family DNA-binding transcriptional regulator [Liquorilactobacillus nagelii]|uniref:LacI family DNA-binding transcriptional regulator n=1 Tax=Liquorilactobacillus nagelii TaxID=82688 RepID=UPI0039E7DF8A